MDITLTMNANMTMIKRMETSSNNVSITQVESIRNENIKANVNVNRVSWRQNSDFLISPEKENCF